MFYFKITLYNIITISSIQRGGSGAACTKNIPRTPIVHVRQTCLAYTHSDPQFYNVRKTLFSYMHSRSNSSCAKNTPDLYRVGVLAQLAHKTYLAYIHSNPSCPCTPNTFFVHTLARQFCNVRKTRLTYTPKNQLSM